MALTAAVWSVNLCSKVRELALHTSSCEHTERLNHDRKGAAKPPCCATDLVVVASCCQMVPITTPLQPAYLLSVSFQPAVAVPRAHIAQQHAAITAACC